MGKPPVDLSAGASTLPEKLFRVTLIIKGLDGVLEVVGGILLLLVTPAQINSFVRLLTQHELSKDPEELIATYLVHAAGSVTISASLFGAAYLMLHGLVKIALVWAVLRNKLWAYPWMIAFLLFFIAFQVYQLLLEVSWGLVLLTAFDIVMVWLTYHEYRTLKPRRPRHQNDRVATDAKVM